MPATTAEEQFRALDGRNRRLKQKHEVLRRATTYFACDLHLKAS